jgi:hypothetical protein
MARTGSSGEERSPDGQRDRRAALSLAARMPRLVLEGAARARR